MPRRILKGRVLSTKISPTVVVGVARLKKHPQYGKRIKVIKKYKAHCGDSELKVGDIVFIQESRPLSKEKRWRIVARI